jgi:hypothetical protein
MSIQTTEPEALISRNTELAFQLLGFDERAPLSPSDMAASLEVVFFPAHQRSETLDAFAGALRDALEGVGARVLTRADASVPGSRGKIRPGVVVVEQGEGKTGALAVHHVSSLHNNPLVAIYDRPCPVAPGASPQETLDAIASVLAWNQTHIPIFVNDGQWTACTMNGAVIQCGSVDRIAEEVLATLVPKLAAQIKPPSKADFDLREGALDVGAEGLAAMADDFVRAARIWGNNGLMLAHTSIDALKYRSRFYKRIVSAFLDHRTGMSYGFLARQLPTDVRPAIRLRDAHPELQHADWSAQPLRAIQNTVFGLIDVADEQWVVEVPDVAVLCTRSGCEKTRLVPKRDLVRLGLSKGRILFDTPAGLDSTHCRPSYDTVAILAHAIGNAVAASLLVATSPAAPFARILATQGLSISHWHGYPAVGNVPAGYSLHGADNPPVSCSTPQSAIFALAGKLAALNEFITGGIDYLGDVHVEPHHGSNVTGCLTLEETAAWVDAQHQAGLLT